MTPLCVLRRAVPALLAFTLLTPAQLNGLEATNDAAILHYQPEINPTNLNKADKTPRQIVANRASRSGWRGAQWRCLDAIIYRESRWNPKAANKHSSARGLFQMLKQDPALSVEEQTERGLRYIKTRYGSPCEALRHHNRVGWY